MLHKRSLLIRLLRERNGAVAAIELRIESHARQPLPVAAVARDLVVDEPLLEDLRAALPVDVAAAAREEAGDGVAAEVVDPAFLLELAHQGVDPGEARAAVFPALEPAFVQGGGDGVGACDEAGGGGDGGGQVPGDEAAVAVADCLGEGVAKRGLGAEVHFAEEELAEEVGGHGGGFFAFALVGGHGVVGAPVEEADGEGAEVVVGGEEGGGLG